MLMKLLGIIFTLYWSDIMNDDGILDLHGIKHDDVDRIVEVLSLLI